MRAPTPRSSGLARVGLVLIAAALVQVHTTPADAGPGKSAVNPITVHLESLTVGDAREFRLAVVHPLFGPKFASDAFDFRHAADAPPDTMGIEAAKRGRLRFVNFGEKTGLVLPGELIRGSDVDYAVRRHTLAPRHTTTNLEAGKSSRKPAKGAASEEPRLLGSLLPPTLRWLAVEGDNPKDLPKEAVAWAKLARVWQGRRSPADLSVADLIRDRVEEYVKELSRLASPPAGTELVGYVGVVDGEVAILESTSAAELFKPFWTRAATAMAVECALLEVRHGLLDQDLPPTGNPDRFRSAVKARILSLYGAKSRRSKLGDTAVEYRLEAKNSTFVRALVQSGKVGHLLAMVKPGSGQTDDSEGMNPGVISRKARPTAAEARFLERRKKRGPPIPTIPPR